MKHLIKKTTTHKETLDYIGKDVEAEDTKLVNQDGIYYDEDTGEIAFVITTLPDEHWVELLRAACLTTTKSVNKTTRASGMATVDAIFGYKPRNSFRRSYCSSSAMSYKEPKQHEIFVEAAEEISKIYKKLLPERYDNHVESAKIFDKDWKLNNTPFTSGVLNVNNQLPYHVDRGNIDGVYSNMVSFCRNKTGGSLHIPLYGLKIDIVDKKLVMFDGQNIVHGVEPFKLGDGGYRYTAVYYSLKEMWRCVAVKEEIQKANNLKEKRFKLNIEKH